MKSFTYNITNEMGIHARPAGLLMKEAKKYSSSVKLHAGEKTADAKKLYAIMMLCVKKGDKVTVDVEGEDEATAAKKIEEFFFSQL